jgi:hypothetical protein
MKKALTTALSAALAMAIAVPAAAGGIEQRQQNQQGRIQQGIHAGSLTPAEAARLEREQFRIERMERRLKADGNFTRRDRARVQHRLDHSSRHIYRAKHNRRAAP